MENKSNVSFIPFLVTFGNKGTKILYNLFLYFARQDGQDEKKRKENVATKVTKVPKTERQKFGMNETIIYLLQMHLIFQKKCQSNFRS